MQIYAVVASAVSSNICASIARKRGFEFHEALTGFKWLNKNALDLETEGKTVLLCYEEALAFNVTLNIVRDKDGIFVAAVFAKISGVTHDSGSMLTQRLEDLMDECGVLLSKNSFYKTTSISATTTEVFYKARVRGFQRDLGGAIVKTVRDLTKGTDTSEEDGKARLPSDPSRQFVTLRCSRDRDLSSSDAPLVNHLRGSGTCTFLPPSN